MKALAEWVFETIGGKLAAGVAALVALVAWWQIEKQHLRTEGKADAVVEINQEAGKLAAKARAARGDAYRGDAVRRLRNPENCRDC